MDIKQIKDTLDRIFSEKNKRIIFWYDGEKEFEEILPSLQLDGVSILRLDEHGALELKIKLESEDTTGKYILYAPYHEPPPEKDWLVDIRLYSYTFHADKASIILKELDLANQSMRPFLQKRRDFFKSQDRLNRLKKWVSPDDSEEDLDLKMLAVITRADQHEPFSILMNMLDSFCTEGKVNLIEPSKPWKDIEKLGLRPAFCQILIRTFGYTTADFSNLTDFLLRIFVTDFSNSLKTELPAALSHFVIQSYTQRMNSSVFLSQWRSNTGHFKNFNLISGFIAEKLKIDDVLITLDIESLLETMTFEAIERRIISAFRNQIGTDSEKRYQELREAIKLRRDTYWATTVLSEDSQENLYQTVYRALEAGIELFDLREKYDAGLSYSGAENMFNAYISELFLFDQYYRKFYELSDKADLAGWDVLKSLREAVENCYSGWFMDQLSLKWGEFLESENADTLLSQWKMPFITNQYDFFKKHIDPTMKESSRNRLFVIISDAFRFEAAEELSQKINGTYRLKAELEPMLGILPSYTALGMAALLPHKTLSFKESPAADILVDGKPAASLDQRADILSSYQGTAIKADDLMSMSKDNGREFVKPHRLIYIFHDRIDAIGDKAVSESNTFEAVRKTINDLFALVRFVIDSLNGTRILITADHGFIYQEKAPAPIDKSKIEINPGDTVKTHKRFILGKKLVSSDKAYSGNTKTSANTDTEMDFLLAKGTNRFSFSGGARFFHGGAMLQEIVIPVIIVSEMKGKHLVASEVKQVGVSLLGSYKKLVTNRPVYRFIQTDPVSDRIKPITLKVSLRDKNELISSEETVTFDSSSSSMDERQKTVKLTLKTGSYDNKKTYFLVLRNIDDTEYDRIPIIIDIAFANDF
jgi:uncharacterized protein (TIGR02687 family)